LTVLVTGSAGHLGEALMLTLQARGRSVLGLDVKASALTDAVGSVTDRRLLRQVLTGVTTVLHTATLHKPHIVSHTHDEFVQTNIAGTLALLEESVAAGVRCFIYTSTTSAFGSALTPPAHEPAAWVTEAVPSVPKNIYGVTKAAAEDLCELMARRHGLPIIVLRTSRFFLEADDELALRSAYSVDNLQANELLYRRIDLEDVVEAHLAAEARACEIGFGRYIISSSTPFEPEDLAELRMDAKAVVRRRFPAFEALYKASGWRMLPSIDRVYVNRQAVRDLGWSPKYGFEQVLGSLASNGSFRSRLAVAVGAKGYHDQEFEDGLYLVY
jgi:UDP-glucose 4-epimerase